MATDRNRDERRMDDTEKRWTDREVIALLRAATAPDFVHDRVRDMIRESRRHGRRPL